MGKNKQDDKVILWEVMPITELWNDYLHEVKVCFPMKSEDAGKETVQHPSNRSAPHEHAIESKECNHCNN